MMQDNNPNLKELARMAGIPTEPVSIVDVPNISTPQADLADEIAEAISDTLDMDWQPSWAAPNIIAIINRERRLAREEGAKAMQSNEGPQPIPVRYTCEGCVHFSEEYWKDYIDNDETDSGHTAKCAKADRTITHYWSTNQAPPSWCPIAALDPAQIVKDKP